MSANLSNELEVIRNIKDRLKDFGIEKIGITKFEGKKGEPDEDDLVVLVEFKDEKYDFSSFMGAKIYLEEALERKIEFGSRSNIKVNFRNLIEKNVVYAF